jgi:phage tail tape-measure protein
MARTVSRLYDTYGQAQRAVNALEAAGYSSSEIGMVSRYRDDETLADTTSAAATGAAAGALAGGGAGLLAALGVIAIPGIGPLVAAGVLATTLVGAAGGGAVGGMLGALTDYGVSEEDAHLYSEAVRRGSTLVTVRADEGRVAKAETILDANRPVSTRERRDAYTATGWSKYDPASKPYTADEIRQERDRYRRR